MGNSESLLQYLVPGTKLDDAYQRSGDLRAALSAFDDALGHTSRLPAHGDRSRWLTLERSIRISIGDVLQRQGDLTGATDPYRAGMAIAERLAASDRDNADWQRDLPFSHATLGDVLTEADDRKAALTHYRAALAIDEYLAAADPRNAQTPRDLFISLLKLAQWLLAASDRPAACALARRAEVQANLLAEHFPQDPQRDDDPREAAKLLADACDPTA
jgi:tetratricopeptide (TPR) repeat protein